MSTQTRFRTFFLCVLFYLCSCVNTKKSTNFNGLVGGIIDGAAKQIESPIQKGDILNINISSLNVGATKIFNTPNTTGDPIAGQISGYLVNADGNVHMPIIGLIKAEGLTQTILADQIRSKILDRKLLVDPIVVIRYLNYRVTVLGEVGSPKVINVPNERITILEALGMAGDLTIYAKRDNVLLVREENEKKTAVRLDLTDKDFLSTPYYFLRPNDVIYVEPNKAKVASASRGHLLLPSILGGLSFLAIVADRVFR